MTSPGIPTVIAASMLLSACTCENMDEPIMDAGPSSSDTADGASSSTTSPATTDPPDDPARWIGRYHYEDPWLELGERGEPFSEPMLVNFEIRADSTASLFYDGCGFPAPIVIAYRWEPPADGRMELLPGEGEARLRFMADDAVDSMRVLLEEPCRSLVLEVDGQPQEWLAFHPGGSCWLDRCTTPGIMQVDYCAGEEPPACP